MSETEIRDVFFNAIVENVPQIRDTNFLNKASTGLDLTFEQLKNYIIQLEALRRMDGEKPVGRDKGGETAMAANLRDRCYKCGTLGHYARDWRNPGLFCYQYRRYEGHVRSDCPYSVLAREVARFRREEGRRDDSQRYGNMTFRRGNHRSNPYRGNNNKRESDENDSKINEKRQRVERGRGNPRPQGRGRGYRGNRGNRGNRGKPQTPVEQKTETNRKGRCNALIVGNENLKNFNEIESKNKLVRFLADTGATQHMSNSRLIFKTLDETNRTEIR